MIIALGRNDNFGMPNGYPANGNPANRLILCDAASGQTSEGILGDNLTEVSIHRILILDRGFATLEAVQPKPGSSTSGQGFARLVFWDAILPDLSTSSQLHPDKVHAFDVSPEGWLVTGGEDHVARCWFDGRLTASLGSMSASYRGLTFVPGGDQALQLRWVESTNNGRGRERCDALDPRDGRTIYSLGGRGQEAGSLLATSPDGRFGVVVGEDHRSEVTLDLWSFEQNRALSRLGRYPYPAGSFGSGLLPRFSPSSRWLLADRAANQGRAMEIWRVPDAVHVGSVPLAKAQDVEKFGSTDVGSSEFDSGETMIRVGSEIFDLETASRKCALDLPRRKDPTSSRLDLEFRLLTDRIAVATWKPSGFFGDAHQFLLWDLSTGARTELGESTWGDRQYGTLGVQSSSDGARLLIYGGLLTEPHIPSSKYRVELWSLSNKKLIRHHEREGDQSQFWKIWGDDRAFYLPEARPVGDRGLAMFEVEALTQAYSWENGEELPRPGETILAHQRPPSIPFPLGWDRRTWTIWAGTNGWSLQINRSVDRNPLAGTAELGAAARPLSLQSDPQHRVALITYRTAQAKSGESSLPGQGVWRLGDGALLFTLPRDETSGGFDPTGAWLVTRGPKGSIGIYATNADREVRRVMLPSLPRATGDILLYLCLNPKGDRLAFVHQGVLYLWDVATDRPVKVFEKPGLFSPVMCVAQSDRTKRVAIGGEEGVVMLWDRDRGEPLRTLIGHSSGVVALAFHPDGGRLASAAKDGKIYLWDEHGARIWESRLDAASSVDALIRKMSFDADGTTLIAGTTDGRLLRLSSRSGLVLSKADVDSGGISIAISPGGRIAASGVRGRILIFEPDLSRQSSAWEVGGPVHSLTFIGDDIIATGGSAIGLWDANSGRQLLSYQPRRGPVRELHYDARKAILWAGDRSEEIGSIDIINIEQALSGLSLDLPSRPPRRLEGEPTKEISKAASHASAPSGPAAPGPARSGDIPSEWSGFQ